MKLGKLLFATLLLIGTSSFAQIDSLVECKRMRLFAQQELKIQNYAGAAHYYLLGEGLCGGYEAANYSRMIGSYRNAKNNTENPDEIKAFADTLIEIWKRTEAANVYDRNDDFAHAAAILESSTPDRAKADELYKRGIDTLGVQTDEGDLIYYYYNMYSMYAAAPIDDRPNLKRRLIGEYFELSALIGEAKMSVTTQETISGYFNYVVQTCDDILPDLKGYIEKLPADPAAKKSAVNNFISVLEVKECTSASEYFLLIDILVELEPNSLETKMKQAEALIAQRKFSAGISALKEAKALATNDADKNKINYKIAWSQFSAGSYKAAYNTAMTVSGKFKGKALEIAGKSVGNRANDCGTSTMERKCNYIYAVQLLEKARGLGERTGGTINTFKKSYPTDDEIFDAGSPTSIPLTCYGISVNPKG